MDQTNELYRKTFPVSDIASLCDVSRGTVGYWIRSGKLLAHRTGRNYLVYLRDLMVFLKSNRMAIPEGLETAYPPASLFATHQDCWEYFKKKDHGKKCKSCLVFNQRLEICFLARDSGNTDCSSTCERCHYYQDVYLPKIQFIHQIGHPAAIYKGFCLLGGNRLFAELCGVDEVSLIGMGIESIVHPDSLALAVSNVKRRLIGDTAVPFNYNLFMKAGDLGKREVSVSISPLTEPEGAYFMIAYSA